MSEAVAEAAVVPAKSGGKLVPILLVVNSLLVAGGIGFMVMKNKSGGAAHGAESGGHAAAASGEGGGEGGSGAAGPTVRLADFVIHLRNPEAERYARLSFELELANEADKTAMTPFLPHVRDIFITYLTDRTAEELRGSEGLERMKHDLAKQLDAIAPNIHVRNIFIADFVLQ
jgi:flagellar FliL protein